MSLVKGYIDQIEKPLIQNIDLWTIDLHSILNSYRGVFSSLGVSFSLTHAGNYVDVLRKLFNETLQNLMTNSEIIDSLNLHREERINPVVNQNPNFNFGTNLDRDREKHAPKDLKKVEQMNEVSEEAQETLNQIGKYKRPAPAPGKNYDSLPVLGPYRHSYGTYTGQYKDGKRHGFGTFVSLFV